MIRDKSIPIMITSLPPLLFFNHTDNYSYLSYQTNNSRSIEKIQNKLQEAASNVDVLGPTLIGCLCIARYKDGNWYRGVVIQLYGPNDVGIRYVDYDSQMFSTTPDP